MTGVTAGVAGGSGTSVGAACTVGLGDGATEGAGVANAVVAVARGVTESAAPAGTALSVELVGMIEAVAAGRIGADVGDTGALDGMIWQPATIIRAKAAHSQAAISRRWLTARISQSRPR